MSEKRFDIVGKEFVGYTEGYAYIIRDNSIVCEPHRWIQWSVWEDKEDVEDLCDLLNELHEESDVLKQQLQTKYVVNKQYEELQRLKEDNKELKKENEQLRLELETHKHPLWSTREAEKKVNKLADSLADEIKKNGLLNEEINQLRIENMRLKKKGGDEMSEKNCEHCKHFQIDGMFGLWCEKDHDWILVNGNCSDFER